MPRKARQESGTGIYHIMLRGINQQNIFHDNEDNLKFLELLADSKVADGFELYGFCLMSNHVHLLMKTDAKNLGQIFKRIGVKYVYWYNLKYKRVGHLFQDRFKSEPVETDEYFLAVLRYVHQNPVKAGIATDAGDYRWSSYGEYIGQHKIADTKFALDITGLESFITIHEIEADISCLEYINAPPRLSDAEAKKIIKGLIGHDDVERIQMLENNERAVCLQKLKLQGISIRQLSRLTGFSKGIVERA